jgi:hypothetical protein
MLKYFFFLVIGLLTTQLYSQGWVQTSATPVGGGVTDLLVRSNGDILASVGSFNWPSVAGGIRKSTDGGQSWQNVASAFNGRTIEEAFDGNLYASIWFYPQNEGIYRSTNGGDNWAGPIYSVPSLNNIFSISVKEGSPNYTILAGTRNGVMRSTDSGASFQSANNGIPANSWVRDMEIDSSGIIAAATTNGVFISTNNGDSWNQASGFSPQDTVVSLAFFYSPAANDAFIPILLAGTDDGNLYQAFLNDVYLLFSFIYARSGRELASINIIYTTVVLTAAVIYLAFYPRFGLPGGIYRSTSDRMAFEEVNEGLPSNIQTSAIGGQVIQTRSGEVEHMVTGLYENTSTGAKIYKRTFVVSVENISSEIPEEYKLEQNYPNPFNPTTTIQFSIPEQSLVKLEVFNSLGEKVTTLVSEELNAGNYKYEWNAEKLSSGIYFYKLSSDNFSEMKKMILLK